MSLLNQLKFIEKGFLTSSFKKADGQIFLFFDNEKLESVVKKMLNKDEVSFIKKHPQKVFSSPHRKLWIAQPFHLVDQRKIQYMQLDPSDFAFYKDYIANLVKAAENSGCEKIELNLFSANADQIEAAVMAVELCLYSYKDLLSIKTKVCIKVDGKAYKVNKSIQAQAAATNMSRHLVNLPTNLLNTESYKNLIKSWFSGENFQVRVWGPKELKKQNMNLLLAVGQAGENPPYLVKVDYKPKTKTKAHCFVGKGIVYDSGGLSIKPTSNMKLMKKDMGGSAAIFGLAHWVKATKYKSPCSFYFSLAENGIASNAFRPGDIYTSRKGLRVEITNTDAEGRLVLADALDVACQENPKSKTMMDFATLTGAIKAALGSDVAGMFANDKSLADDMVLRGLKTGDRVWSMPLIQDYKKQLSSVHADIVNSADGFGGAVTAALFLQYFVSHKKWLHFDLYAWKDQPSGCFTEVGASGQPVQTVIEYLKTQ